MSILANNGQLSALVPVSALWDEALNVDSQLITEHWAQVHAAS